jgi:hypothetical protein
LARWRSVSTVGHLQAAMDGRRGCAGLVHRTEKCTHFSDKSDAQTKD